MEKTRDNKLKNLIVVGDKILISPENLDGKTRGGLFLPPGYQEKEEVQTGYVIKTGPGYPVPSPDEPDEPWKNVEDKVKYIPLQTKPGDKAIFLQKGAVEVIYRGEKYYIISQHAILLLERDEGLFT
ncbi:MAG: co-chaperone GroES [Bacteroidales bacterium]|nr:co-chaperone GroES [Bacteroidales bacterium]